LIFRNCCCATDIKRDAKNQLTNKEWFIMSNTQSHSSNPLFEIRSGGTVFNRAQQPAVVFDKQLGTLYRIGESADMETYYKVVNRAYEEGGFPEMARSVVFMDLPKDQDEIDKVFQITGYVKKLYNQTKPQH